MRTRDTLARLLCKMRTMLCKFLFKTTRTIMLKTPRVLPLQQQNTSVRLRFFFYGRYFPSLSFITLQRGKVLSRQSFYFKRQTTGHLEHSGKCTMPLPAPVYVCRIEHIQPPLTFRWMCTLPEWKQRWGQRTLSLHPLLYFPYPAICLPLSYLPNVPHVIIQYILLPVNTCSWPRMLIIYIVCV